MFKNYLQTIFPLSKIPSSCYIKVSKAPLKISFNMERDPKVWELTAWCIAMTRHLDDIKNFVLFIQYKSILMWFCIICYLQSVEETSQSMVCAWSLAKTCQPIQKSIIQYLDKYCTQLLNLDNNLTLKKVKVHTQNTPWKGRQYWDLPSTTLHNGNERLNK